MKLQLFQNFLMKKLLKNPNIKYIKKLKFY